MIQKIIIISAGIIAVYLLLILLDVWSLISLSADLWAKLTASVILITAALGVWAGALALKKEHTVTNANGDNLIK